MAEICETRVLNTNQVCGHPARFLVQVGTRKYDAQHSCGQHLARTCVALAYGDSWDDPPKYLTVITLAPV